MASDTEASRRKHRRSPTDDDAPALVDEEKDKPSKRHKHRHHHRHHRSHRSKKHDGDDKSKQDGGGGHDEVSILSSAPPPPPVPNDDVEEGEILEEEDNFTSQNLAVHADKVDSGLTNSGSNVSLPNAKPGALDELDSRNDHKSLSNGDLGREKYSFETKKQHGDSRTASRGIYKQKSHRGDFTPEGDDVKLNDRVKPLSSKSGEDKLETVARGASCDRYHDEVIVRSRSRSRSILDEDALLKRRRLDDKAENDSGDERMPRHDMYMQGGSRDVERERSTGYNQSLGREESHGSWGSQGREREMAWVQRREHGREMSRERDQRRDKDRERSRDLDLRMEKDRERSRGREIDRDQRGAKEWERRKDREIETDQRREKERMWSRDMEIERDRRREKPQERSWDRDVDKDRREERGRGRSLDRRSWDRDVDKDRREERGRDRSMDRRSWDRDVDKDRREERGRDRSLDRRRDMEHRRNMDMERQENRSKEKDIYRTSDRQRHREGEGRDRDNHPVRERVKDRDWRTDRESLSDRNRDKDKDSKGNSAKVYNSNSGSLGGDREKLERDEDEQDEFEERIALKLAEQDEDLDRVKEESRKRRQAILEKYRNQKKPQQNDTQLVHVEKADSPLAQCSVQLLTASNAGPDSNNAKVESDPSIAASASESIHVKMESDVYVTEPVFSVGKTPPQNGNQASERISGAAGLGEGTPKSEGSDEKYCDDIFAETPTRVRKPSKGDGLQIARSSLYDNWDDPDGYYDYRFGERLDGRYEIVAAQGKGVFSTVVRAKDLKAGVGEPQEVAIKILRNKEQMHKAGQNEELIFSKLAAADPDNKRHCVRFLSSFKYRNHLCLVFESLHMNLREVLKKFGRNIGLKLTAVRAYAKQLFIALKHLKNCEVLHCDIKPDNMLVNEAKNVLKLCDFGNAMLAGKNEITPYLVSRFYRAPEIILGLPYDHPVDMWSVGCCLYELYAGKVLFPGATNSDMLRLHMELKGPFPKKMLKKGGFVDQHFDQDLNFNSIEEDPVTKKIIKRVLVNVKQKEIGSIIKISPGDDSSMLSAFKDLLDKIFVLDPEKRLTVHQALAHPFIKP
ncbi:uncharacterized protein LOC126674130 isoform X2 [Mercurialis annua]|uniref:uncharacterized protein LOC126674130 isoform X2 n=1 Tax=Mercurialis annua TaxID=3986 RepID=UPI0021603521|nr:uncharacterized protein LOC126674130 isoform X2 [Mercurialis annua]